MDMITEGKAKIAVPRAVKVSADMPVFYNPVMKSNRDLTVLLMKAAMKEYGIKKWRVADPMAATGIRGIRMIKEIGSSKIELLEMNDYSADAVALIKKNLLLNGIKTGKKVVVTNTEANKFLIESQGFNYIDIDPFGYPGTFLDAAMKRISRNGILAVTATDTSALAGSAPDACMRKYWAAPLRNGFMHETGVRIMVRLVQLLGAMHGKAMTPIFSYYKEHYIRAFFLAKSGAHRADEILMQHKEIIYCGSCGNKGIFANSIDCRNCGKKMAKAGPLWTGRLFDEQLARRMTTAADGKIKDFLGIITKEAAVEGKCGVGFYTTEELSQKYKLGVQPKTAGLIEQLRKKGYDTSPTHCTNTGVKTDAPLKAVMAASKHKI